jgi:putative hydrolase of the HAD superfamily
MATPPLQAVLFDLDDTLLDTADVERRRWVAVCELLRRMVAGIDLAEFERRYRPYDRGRVEVHCGELPYDAFRRERLTHALEPWTPVDRRLFSAYVELSNAIADGIQPLPGARALLRQLRVRGIAAGVVTNGPSAWQRRKLEITGIDGLVDAVVVSGEISVLKPDPRPFLIACERLGVPPAAAVMVGDKADVDITGAEAAGLGAAVHVGPGGATLSDVARLLALRDAG